LVRRCLTYLPEMSMDQSPRSPLQMWLTGLVAAGLLLIVCGLAFRWYVAHRAAVAAAEAYERVRLEFELGTVTEMDVCLASEALCRAEQAVPFAKLAAAQSRHVERLREREVQLEAAIPVTMYGDLGREAANTLRRIKAMRAAAEKRLHDLQSP
jgi:hypothetical protein